MKNSLFQYISQSQKQSHFGFNMPNSDSNNTFVLASDNNESTRAVVYIPQKEQINKKLQSVTYSICRLFQAFTGGKGESLHDVVSRDNEEAKVFDEFEKKLKTLNSTQLTNVEYGLEIISTLNCRLSSGEKPTREDFFHFVEAVSSDVFKNDNNLPHLCIPYTLLSKGCRIVPAGKSIVKIVADVLVKVRQNIEEGVKALFGVTPLPGA